jgi:hypothetical protein
MDFLLFKLTKAGGFERNHRKVKRSVSEIGIVAPLTDISKKNELQAFLSKTLQVEKEKKTSQFDKYIRNKVQRVLE